MTDTTEAHAKGALGELEMKVRNRPRTSLYSKRDRARFTVYELQPDEENRELKTYHLVTFSDIFFSLFSLQLFLILIVNY